MQSGTRPKGRDSAQSEPVWCRYCTEYPARSRQPGSGMCVAANSGRSIDSRPCAPKLTLTARLRKLFGRPIG
jgi:hypothetical protein